MKQTEFEELARQRCAEYGVSYGLFQELLAEERRVRHLKRRRGITERLRQMITESLERNK